MNKNKKYLIRTPVPMNTGWGQELARQLYWFEHVNGIFRGYDKIHEEDRVVGLEWEITCTSSQLTLLLLKTDATLLIDYED